MRRTFLRGLALSAASSAAVAAVGLVRNVLIARVMGPAAFGLWQLCLVALRFAPEVHGGALHAVAMDGPVLRGEGRDDEARDLERRATGIALLHALVFGLAVGVALRLLQDVILVAPTSRSGTLGLGTAALLLGAACFCWQWFHADAVVLRTRRQFGRLALLQGVFAVAHLAGLLLLVPGWFVSGALAAWIGGTLLAVVTVRLLTRDPLPVAAPGVHGGGPVRRGMAAWLVDLQQVTLLQADRIVVVVALGSAPLGYWGVLPLAGSLVLFLPDVLARVLWPFAGEHFGRSGSEAASLRPFAEGALLGLAPVLAAGSLLALQGTDLLVARVLPNYEAALVPLRWYLPGVYFTALLVPLRPLLVTAGEGRTLFRLQGIVGILTIVAQFAVTRVSAAGTDPQEWVAVLSRIAAVGSAGSAVLFCGTLRLAAGRLDLGRRAAWMAVAVLLLGTATVAADHVLLRWGGDLANSLPAVALRVGLPGVLMLLSLVVIAVRNRRTGEA